MKKRIFYYLVIFLLILNIVYPQNLCGTSDNPCKDNWANFDYSDTQADISKIPPDKVDITKVIANGRGKELTVNQIKESFDKIDNLNDLDLEKTKQAISEKYEITVEDFGQSASLKNGVLQANFGKQDSVTITREVYKNGFFSITKNGEIIFIPTEDIKKLEFPEGDTLIVKDLQNLVDFQNHQIKGTFKINKDGTATFLKGHKSIIDNININPILDNADFCKIKSSCLDNYLFLGEKELIAEGNGFVLDFDEKNPYFDVAKIKEKDSKIISLGDFQNKPGKINIQVESNLLPLIKNRWFC